MWRIKRELTGQPDRGKRENRDEKYSVMMAKIDFELMKDTDLHIHKAKQISRQ